MSNTTTSSKRKALARDVVIALTLALAILLGFVAWTSYQTAKQNQVEIDSHNDNQETALTIAYGDQLDTLLLKTTEDNGKTFYTLRDTKNLTQVIQTPHDNGYTDITAVPGWTKKLSRGIKNATPQQCLRVLEESLQQNAKLEELSSQSVEEPQEEARARMTDSNPYPYSPGFCILKNPGYPGQPIWIADTSNPGVEYMVDASQ